MGREKSRKKFSPLLGNGLPFSIPSQRILIRWYLVPGEHGRVPCSRAEWASGSLARGAMFRPGKKSFSWLPSVIPSSAARVFYPGRPVKLVGTTKKRSHSPAFRTGRWLHTDKNSCRFPKNLFDFGNRENFSIFFIHTLNFPVKQNVSQHES